MSSNKRSFMRTLLRLPNGGCGCNKPNSSDVYQPTPKPKISIYQNTNPSSLNSSTTSCDEDDEDFTSTTISESETHHHDHSYKINEIPKPSTKLVNSIAVEKESKNPHKDFRDSMLQMIFEREIFSESDLQELLERFLQLNATCHHQVIVEAFSEICEEAFPKKKVTGVGEACRSKQMMIPKSR